MNAVGRPATPASRWLIWLALLAGAAALALFGDKTPPGAARPADVASRTAPAPAPAPRARAAVLLEPVELLLARTTLAAAALPPRADLFATPAWRQPPPPPVAKALPPGPAASAPPPAAPPLPYVFIGKKLEADAWEIFLGRADNAFIVREGGTVEGAWRVEKIEPPKATLRHLPSGQTQALDIGAAP